MTKIKSTVNVVDAWHATLRNGRAIIAAKSVKRMHQATIRNRRCMGVQQ